MVRRIFARPILENYFRGGGGGGKSILVVKRAIVLPVWTGKSEVKSLESLVLVVARLHRCSPFIVALAEDAEQALHVHQRNPFALQARLLTRNLACLVYPERPK